MKILELMSFERKKMLKRKSFWISNAAVLGILLLFGYVMSTGKVSVNGEYVCTQYELIQIEKEVGNTMKGMEITEEKLTEAKEQWKLREEELQNSTDMTPSRFLEIKKKYMPAELLLRFIYPSLEEMERKDYYTARIDNMAEQWESMELSQSEQDYLKQKDEKTAIPWTYGYNEAYTKFEGLQMSIMLMISFLIAICIAPLFTEEYTSHVDALMLSSKYGRGKVFAAKIIMGGLTSVIIMAAGVTAMLTEQIMIYGSGDLSAPMQVLPTLTQFPYSFSAGGLIAVTYACSAAAALMAAAVVILCSACMKSSFGPVIMGIIVSILPFFSGLVPATTRGAYMAVHAIPGVFVDPGSFFSQYLLGAGDFWVPAYLYVPVFYGVLAILLTVFAKKGYLNREP